MKALNNPQEIREIIQKRLRRVGEPLVSDAGLRDELTDDQAQQLLDWGMARLVRLGKNLQWLYNTPSDRECVRHIRRFKQQPHRLDREAAFQLLMLILSR